MVKALLTIAAGAAALLWANHVSAQNPLDKVPDVVVHPGTWDMVCMSDEDFQKVVGKGLFFALLNGFTPDPEGHPDYITQFWEAAGSGMWMVSITRTGVDLTCILVAGDRVQQPGSEAEL